VHSRTAVVRLNEWNPSVVEALVVEGVREIARAMYGGDRSRVVPTRELRPSGAVADRCEAE
jgi:hypothetical protein